jgi:4-diphosphocytidyl-2-C-methyl-D-erythritol kinase
MLISSLVHAASRYGTSITAHTQAKINLSLIITGKRADGYHELHSHVVFCTIGDRITITPTHDATLRLYVSGRFGATLRHATEDNLILRVASALRDRCHAAQGALIHLEKSLPLASGIGGGSGDAALTLHLLNQLWDCRCTPAMLAELGKEFGADIPVCVHGTACVMQGIGEVVHPIAPQDRIRGWMVLVTPPIEVPTARIFSVLPEALYIRSAEETDALCRMTDPTKMHNDLEEVALALYAPIASILAELRHHPHTMTARISGSGATCFALCIGRSDAQSLADYMQRIFPDAWVRYGRI